MSRRRTAMPRSAISLSGMPAAQAAATSEPMLLPITRLGSSPRSNIMTIHVSPHTSHVSPSYDVAALRQAEFPWAVDTVYLDHASVGPMPERTRRALEQMGQKRARPFEIRPED